MKKILIAIAFLLPMSLPLLSAQTASTRKVAEAEKNNSTPLSVTTAFKKRFPTVTKVSFGREKNGEYEAEFKLDGVKSSANFTAKGTWKETESEISAGMLPANIIQSISVIISAS